MTTKKILLSFIGSNDAGKLRQMIKNNNEIPMTTFRLVVSKINKKISHPDLNSAILENFIISSEGKRGAKFYFIKAPYNKLNIVL